MNGQGDEIATAVGYAILIGAAVVCAFLVWVFIL
jgi:hypothetical protein